MCYIVHLSTLNYFYHLIPQSLRLIIWASLIGSHLYYLGVPYHNISHNKPNIYLGAERSVCFGIGILSLGFSITVFYFTFGEEGALDWTWAVTIGYQCQVHLLLA